jgi:hypothetical protein
MRDDSHQQESASSPKGGVFAGANDDRSTDSRLSRSPRENAVAGVSDSVLAVRQISRRLYGRAKIPR